MIPAISCLVNNLSEIPLLLECFCSLSFRPNSNNLIAKGVLFLLSFLQFNAITPDCDYIITHYRLHISHGFGL